MLSLFEAYCLFATSTALSILIWQINLVWKYGFRLSLFGWVHFSIFSFLFSWIIAPFIFILWVFNTRAYRTRFISAMHEK